VGEHIRRLGPDAVDLGQEANHRVRSFLRSRRRFQPARTGLLDGVDLRAHEAEPLEEAEEFGARVRRQERSLGGDRVAGLSATERRVGLKLCTPKRVRIAFMRLMSRVCSPTRASRSRFGRRASSSTGVGIAAVLQWRFSPRSQPRKARNSSLVSRRSVLARRCSRETATLEG